MTSSYFASIPSSLSPSTKGKESPRVLSSVFGNVIESIPFLPLNLNVPDALTGMYSLVTQYFGTSEPKSSSNKKKKKKKKKTTTTTTTTTTPKPNSEEFEDAEVDAVRDEDEESEDDDDDDDDEEEAKRRIDIKDYTANANLDEMFEDFIRRKELERKRKKKRGKHKHDDMLEKIASHLAFLELEC